MKVYIEDTSSNGTYINGSVRLTKGQVRQLNSGDEICLFMTDNQEEYEECSFIFTFIDPHSHMTNFNHPHNNLNTFNYNSAVRKRIPKQKQTNNQSIKYLLKEMF